MSTLFQEFEPVDTELHLGIGVILAIFAGITLVSAVFFGLGYSFGRTGNVASEASPVQALSSQVSAQSVMNSLHTAVVPAAANSTTSQKSSTQTARYPLAAALTHSSASHKISTVPPSDGPAVHHAAIARTAPASAPGSASYMVQVAAVANRNDAQALASALQKHGLNAKLRSGTHDKFFHVQIGPFATQQKAEAMRHKVIAAGYRAILKPTS
ncbi:MAG TPA: SPOR domain-containing protein [Acidobacteriaceae bacterium]|jgi:cell division protein FtsN|nr:SPOR domain-containing protein [Acidobacteriaceae bacterium]